MNYTYYITNVQEYFRNFSEVQNTARSNRRYDGNFKRRIKRSVEK